MIAPAMNTRPQEALSFRDLARQQARISRQISLQELSRLSELVADAGGSAALDVSLQFGMDSRGFSRVDGTVSGQLPLLCQRCAEELVHPLSLSFGCFIVESDALADELAANGESPGDVLVAAGNEVTTAEIVEDEILLSLPEWLCEADPCSRAPELAYPAAQLPEGAEQAPGSEPVEAAENPFSVLAELDLGAKTDK